VAAAGLQEGVIDPDEPFYCPGSFKLGRRTYRCWKRQGHGEMNLHDALVQSCDVYFYRVGLELGIDRLAFYANGFNLGRRSGIALPQEKSGLVPTRAWKEKRHAEPWIRGETVSASIGQGYNLVTPLQLTFAYAGLATGGQLMRPRLLLRKTGRDGSVTEGPSPELRATIPVAPEHLARIRDALEGVVGEPRGTGGRARIRGVRVAGKTGTVQVVRLEHTEGIEDDEVPIRHRDHAWFVGFAPVEAPEIVVAALVEHGGHGGSAAAPIVRRVLERYFEKRKGAEALRVAEAPEAGLAND
jgi:penicillin-binding protein 2